ncbi:MAG: alpha/beta hydrolase [Nanoarchaeota archaeon]
MKKVIIVHGSPPNIEKSLNPKTRTYDKHWIPWIKKELIGNGLKVFTPLMPEPWYPDYNIWKKEFEKIFVDEESILIGHSAGCAFLVRWLGETRKKINRLILVAPWKIADKEKHKELFEIKEKFYHYPIDNFVKNNVGEIIYFTSNDEDEDGKKSVKIFNDALGGKIIELKNHGHFTLGDMGTEEFPELLEEVLK